MNRLAILLIKAYQTLFRPLLGPVCRFHPSCSDYALQAFSQFPFWKALIITSKRLLRCGPWSPGGRDEIKK